MFKKVRITLLTATIRLGIKLACGVLCFNQIALSGDKNVDNTNLVSQPDSVPGTHLASLVPTATTDEKITNSNLSAEEQLIQQKGLFRIYRSNLLKLTYRHIIYPESAIARNHQGDVLLKVLLHRNGTVKDVFINERAGYNSLNKAAKIAVKRAAPYPPPPAGLIGDIFEILMPIKFRLATDKS